jgi:hypothetical protein
MALTGDVPATATPWQATATRRQGAPGMQWDRIFGGNPLSVIIRLVVLSIVVGIVLSALGITFDNLFWRLEVFVKRIYDMGWDAVEWAVQYFLLGAIIVVPIWVIARLVG